MIYEPAYKNKLTNKQKIVLCYMAEGYTARAVAQELNISTWTVQDHLRNISRVLDTQSVTHSVATAIRMGEIIPAMGLSGQMNWAKNGGMDSVKA